MGDGGLSSMIIGLLLLNTSAQIILNDPTDPYVELAVRSIEHLSSFNLKAVIFMAW